MSLSSAFSLNLSFTFKQMLTTLLLHSTILFFSLRFALKWKCQKRKSRKKKLQLNANITPVSTHKFTYLLKKPENWILKYWLNNFLPSSNWKTCKFCKKNKTKTKKPLSLSLCVFRVFNELLLFFTARLSVFTSSTRKIKNYCAFSLNPFKQLMPTQTWKWQHIRKPLERKSKRAWQRTTQ